MPLGRHPHRPPHPWGKEWSFPKLQSNFEFRGYTRPGLSTHLGLSGRYVGALSPQVGLVCGAGAFPRSARSRNFIPTSARSRRRPQTPVAPRVSSLGVHFQGPTVPGPAETDTLPLAGPRAPLGSSPKWGKGAQLLTPVWR